MSQRSILSYFSKASPAPKRPSPNENSPDQRAGGDCVRDETTPVKRSRTAGGESSRSQSAKTLPESAKTLPESAKTLSESAKTLPESAKILSESAKTQSAKRRHKWINRVEDDDEDDSKKLKTTPKPSVVDISFDEDDVSSYSSPVASGSKATTRTVSTPTSRYQTVSTPTSKYQTVSTPTSRCQTVSTPTSKYQTVSTPKSAPKKRVSTPSSALSSFGARESGLSEKSSSEKDGGGSTWPPKDPEYSFLWPENMRDKEKRRPDDPEYDEKTLYVPAEFISKQTDAKKQWWKIKADKMDTVLAFKVGKFYELFYMDALIGIEHLNLLQMGNSAFHSGFPEVSFPKYADILRERGFRVTRVEQTESNEARNRRLKGGGKAVKCVNRESCQIITPGVSLLNDFDSESCNKHSSRSIYLMAVCQKPRDGDLSPEFGVCFVDSAIGKVFIAQFRDDQQCSRLRTLLAHHYPSEMLVEKKYKDLCEVSVGIVKNYLSSVVKQELKSETEFLSVRNTMKAIREGKYFENEDGALIYPSVLKDMLLPDSSSPLPHFCLAFRSLGAIIWYLTRCLVDEDVLTLKNFEQYIPTDSDVCVDGVDMDTVRLPSHLILDAVTLDNLDIVGRNPREKRETLFGLLNNCSTQFGERELRQMVHSPSCDIDVINDRLDGIEDIEGCLKKEKRVFDFLKKLPDLEKILCKLHSESIKRKKDHPDTRAQMFTDVDVKKVRSFLELLHSLEKIGDSLRTLHHHVSDFKSTLLKSSLAPLSLGGHLPDLKHLVQEFKKTFDVVEARESGKIVPEEGSDPDYDTCCQRIRTIEKRLEAMRKRECKFFNSEIDFVDDRKKRYLLKVPEKVFERVNPPEEYLVESAVKGFKRLSTKRIESVVSELKEAEEMKDGVMSKNRRNLFSRFTQHQAELMRVIKCLAVLDALLSLTKTKEFLSRYSTLCRPSFLTPDRGQMPFISIQEGRNPILMQFVDDYIPNDIHLSDKVIILTGPNMGGKSTLMRTVGLITVLAQIGSFVPASRVTLTPVDRIFTRLGAADNIVEGESTFMVELNQTCTIMTHASINSLVLLDELGRGTATHDGTAIASSVLHRLASHIKCRTLFSTHYHSLVEEFEGNPFVTSNHMSCIVEKNEDGSESIGFLYKIQDGDCPKSYGFHAARLAGLPDHLVRIAEEKARETETEFQILRKIGGLVKGSSAASEARKLLTQLKALVI